MNARTFFGKVIFLRLTQLIVIIALSVWLVGFWKFSDYIHTRQTPEKPQSRTLVVLTGGEDRIRIALELLIKGDIKRVFISGVAEHTTLDLILKTLSIAPETLPCCIELGYSAKDTITNAKEIADWSRRNKSKEITILTSTYHMPRTLLELHYAAPDIILHPFPIRSQAQAKPASNLWLLCKEYTKLLIAWARIRLDSFQTRIGNKTAPQSDIKTVMRNR